MLRKRTRQYPSLTILLRRNKKNLWNLGLLLFSNLWVFLVKDPLVFKTCTAWKVSKYGVFPGPYFSVFWLNAEICESQTGCFKKTKHVNFAKNEHFFTPWHAHLRVRNVQGVRNVRFSENLTCSVFLKHPFWDS